MNLEYNKFIENIPYKFKLNTLYFKTGFLNNIAKMSAGVNEQESVNQNQRNDLQEGKIDAGLQSDMGIAPGVRIAGRIYGMTVAGDRALGNSTSPSSANIWRSFNTLRPTSPTPLPSTSTRPVGTLVPM